MRNLSVFFARGFFILAALALAPAAIAAPPQSDVPRIAHVTVVFMENREDELVVGNKSAPYFNKELVPQGVLMTNSHAVSHPSEPNYLALFGGSTFGVTSDKCPLSFDAPNLASEAIKAGLSFAGYAESMPQDGYTGCRTILYARKHVPWVDFTNVPASLNLAYHGFPAQPASVMFITPNMCNDMHDCPTLTGDRWLQRNLPPIIAWNMKNDGLLVITWDEAEPDNGTNKIPTLLIGPMLKAGTTSSQRIDHYAVLRTIETALGLGCLQKDCSSSPIAGIWR
ncbi:MAG TPA: alkaline phosphatase family protein [Candidatus Tumulicola sp.]|jgi:acid phosphatase